MLQHLLSLWPLLIFFVVTYLFWRVLPDKSRACNCVPTVDLYNALMEEDRLKKEARQAQQNNQKTDAVTGAEN